MTGTVNPKFPLWQLLGNQPWVYTAQHRPMEAVSSMAMRITHLIGSDSTREVAAKLALRGIRVTHTSVAKWKSGGDIEEKNLAGLCEIYGSTPAYIRYGVRPTELNEAQQAAADLVKEKPEMVQEAFDFVRYRMQGSAIEDPKGFSRYMSMIDKILKWKKP